MVDLKTLVSVCDDEEIVTILDAIALQNKRLLSKWINENDDIEKPPVEAPPVEENTEMSAEDMSDLQDLTLDMTKECSKTDKYAGLEEVVKGIMEMGYKRVDILTAISFLLDHGTVYEPDVGLLGVVE